jgi:hypothetical protein
MLSMKPPVWWYVLLVSFLSSMLVSVFSLILAVHIAQSTGRKFCAVLAAQSSPEAPATTDRGRVVADRIRELQRSLDCP